MTLDAAQHRSGKGSGDENFPVASWLVAPQHRRPILAFYEFVRIADDIADHATLSETDKLAHLDRLEASLRQSARLAASDGALHTSLDANAYANAVMAFVVGRWHQFAKSGFKRMPLENFAQSWSVFAG